MTSASGRPIEIGDVLIHDDGTRGVVVEIGREGGRGQHVMFVGDFAVQTGWGTHRCGNEYSKWRHLDRRDTMPIERWRSWNARDWSPDDDSELVPDEQFAIDGIAALLPDDDDYPMSIDEALQQLAVYLQTLHACTKR